MTELDRLQLEIYTNKKNYQIEYTGDGKDCVAIYITSNNLFYPHNVENFKWSVLEKDRFEWTRMKVRRAQKHIFLRDVYKQWYASGINSELNNIDKVIEWLREEIKGYSSIVCIGSSGGGYLATILGPILKADIVLNFNGQWNIFDNIERNGEIISPVLKKYLDATSDEVKYYNIAQRDFDYHRTFYFVSTRSAWDKRQLSLLKDLTNIHIIRFYNSHHGIPFLKCSLPILINMNFEKLCKLDKSLHIPVLFDIKVSGFVTTMKFLFNLIIKLTKKCIKNDHCSKN